MRRDRYSTVERQAERRDVIEQAHTLAMNLPQEPAKRQEYIRNLLVKTLHKELDPEVVEEFIKLTNTQKEIEACLTRAKLIAK